MPAKWVKYYKIESFSVLSFLGIHLQGYLGNTNSKYSRSCPFLHYFQILNVWFQSFHSMDCNLSSFFPTVCRCCIEKHFKTFIQVFEGIWTYIIQYSEMHIWIYIEKLHKKTFEKNLFVIFMASQHGRSLHDAWVPYIR